MFIDFAKKMTCWLSEERRTAKPLLDHPFLTMPESRLVLSLLCSSCRHTCSLFGVCSGVVKSNQAATETTDLARFFSYDKTYSAKTSLPKPVGKPAPDVYVHAMKKLGVKPSERLAFEDSCTRMQAAIAAKIACVGYIGCYFGKARQVQLEGNFDEMGAVTTIYHWSEFRALVKKITAWE